LGVFTHQRKLFSLPLSGPKLENPGPFAGGLIAALGAGSGLAPFRAPIFAPRAPQGFALPGPSGVAGRRVELPAVKFLELRRFSQFPEKFFQSGQVASQALSPRKTLTGISSCGLADATTGRKQFLTMHQCGEKENPWLKPTQYCMNAGLID